MNILFLPGADPVGHVNGLMVYSWNVKANLSTIAHLFSNVVIPASLLYHNPLRIRRDNHRRMLLLSDIGCKHHLVENCFLETGLLYCFIWLSQQTKTVEKPSSWKVNNCQWKLEIIQTQWQKKGSGQKLTVTVSHRIGDRYGGHLFQTFSNFFISRTS